MDRVKRIVRGNFRIIEWALTTFAIVVPMYAWLSEAELDEKVTLYDIFPPLGLVAFGLMWTHFITAALRRFSGAERPDNGAYMVITMALVLALIILHPGLLWLALYLDGFGLPPFSYMEVYEKQLPYLALGTLGLTIFLAYEFKRVFGEKKWWKYVYWAQVVGMAAIFIHALELGNELRLDWFNAIWWLYGVTLLAGIIYIWRYDATHKEE